MSEEFIPSLTLDPNPTAAAVQEAPAEVEEKKEEEAPVEKVELSSLSPAEQAAVRNFAEQIDVTNTEQILNYGSAAQKNISEFSDAALNTVRTKDLGEAGNRLSDLVVQLQGLNFEPEEKKGLRGLFRKAGRKLKQLSIGDGLVLIFNGTCHRIASGTFFQILDDVLTQTHRRFLPASQYSVV